MDVWVDTRVRSPLFVSCSACCFVHSNVLCVWSVLFTCLYSFRRVNVSNNWALCTSSSSGSSSGSDNDSDGDSGTCSVRNPFPLCVVVRITSFRSCFVYLNVYVCLMIVSRVRGFVCRLMLREIFRRRSAHDHCGVRGRSAIPREHRDEPHPPAGLRASKRPLQRRTGGAWGVPGSSR
jgi:hypothetical protein